MARVRNGNRRAFSELVRRHEASVFRVCFRILGNREDARDAAQEAFIRAYKKIDGFEGRSSFKTWMLRLTVNVSLNERSRRKEDLPLEDWAPDRIPGPEAELMSAEALAKLHKALQALQPNHRAAVVLHDLEGLTFQEVGESLEVGEQTAKSWAYRGRQRLKDLLT
ncbi:MAG: RNA polymerase sigma factor [Rubrobacteraceae bacterium]